MLTKAPQTTTSLDLRWPEPIFIRIGYVFESRFNRLLLFLDPYKRIVEL